MMDKSIEISKGVTIEDYELLCDNKNKAEIAEMVYNRFYDRYLKPFSFANDDFKKDYKNGFSMMASACLLIETYMAFQYGAKSTKGKGKKYFKNFFNEEPEFEIFKDISTNNGKNTIPYKFYCNIRCGIMHQGETNEGWTITRKKDSPLFNKTTFQINAHKFQKELDNVLLRYKNELQTKDWTDEIWINLVRKMDYVIKNCKKVEL